MQVPCKLCLLCPPPLNYLRISRGHTLRAMKLKSRHYHMFILLLSCW